MRLPGADRAFVDVHKLRGYCLSPDHPRGRHKARVFYSRLGLGVEDVERLREALVEAALTQGAEATEDDEFGQRYVLDFEMTHGTKSARIRSNWIVRGDEEFPRLTTCYVL